MSDLKTKKGYAQQAFMLGTRNYQPGDEVECEAGKYDELKDNGFVGSTKPRIQSNKKATKGVRK